MAVSRLVLRVLGPLVALALVSCGSSSQSFTGTQLARGVDGTLEVNTIEGGNHEVRVVLRHLPPPARLGHGLTEFAMWLVPHGHGPVLGSYLQYDEESRVGIARATTPSSNFEVRVTAERGRNVTSPSEHVIVRRRVN